MKLKLTKKLQNTNKTKAVFSKDKQNGQTLARRTKGKKPTKLKARDEK